jgi:hypothetical protein
MARKTRYAKGWLDGIDAAAQFLGQAHVSPPEAQGHWVNAGCAIRMLSQRQASETNNLAPPSKGHEPR